MERLTDRCWRNLDPWECCGQNFHCSRKLNDDGGCINGCIVPKLYKHLAEYEDLEEQGLLLELPCKIGDNIWWLNGKYLMKGEVESIVIDEDGINIIHARYCHDKEHNRYYGSNLDVENIGKTVFLNKEEAEKALKRLECEE